MIEWHLLHEEPRGLIRDKVWLTNGQESALFKPDSSDFGEAVAEVESYRIAQALGIPCARAELFEWDGKQGALSYNFKSNSNIGYVAAGKLCEGMEIKGFVPNWDNPSMKIIREQLPHLQEQMVDMLYFDCLIKNNDRHGENFEIEISKEGEIIKIAPLFDHGLSLNPDDPLDHCCVGWDSTRESVPHFEMFKRLSQHYSKQIKYLLDKTEHVELNPFCSLRYKEMLTIFERTGSSADELSMKKVTHLHTKAIIIW